MSNPGECMGVNRYCVQFIKSCFLLQCHVRIHIRYYKSHACVRTCDEIESSYDKIIMTIVPIKLYQKMYHSFVAVGIVTHAVHS